MHGKFILTREQVRRIDELAQTEYGLPGIVLMENAGSGAARIIDQHYGPRGVARVVCGTGNNGGDGLVIARHLHIFGWKIQVLVAGQIESMTPDCAVNDRVMQAMHLQRHVAADIDELPDELDTMGADTVIIDALLGTGFKGVVRPMQAALIDRLNALPKKAMVAIDVPSGLDCDSGLPGGSAIRADLTITFVAEKPGFLTESGRSHVGQCHVVGIGIPPELIDRVAGTSK